MKTFLLSMKYSVVCICKSKVTDSWDGIQLSSWRLTVLLMVPTVLFELSIIQSVAQSLNCSATTSPVCHLLSDTVVSCPFCNCFFFLFPPLSTELKRSWVIRLILQGGSSGTHWTESELLTTLYIYRNLEN